MPCLYAFQTLRASYRVTDPHKILFPKETAEQRHARAARVTAFLAGLSTQKAWEVIVKPFRRTRSNPQNAYERGVCCVLLAKAVGYEPDDIHDYLLGRYFGWKQQKCPKTPSNPRGVRDVPVRTTTTNEYGERDVLDKQRYWDFVEFIQRFGAEHGVYIPDPDPEYATRHQRKAA